MVEEEVFFYIENGEIVREVGSTALIYIISGGEFRV